MGWWYLKFPLLWFTAAEKTCAFARKTFCLKPSCVHGNIETLFFFFYHQSLAKVDNAITSLLSQWSQHPGSLSSPLNSGAKWQDSCALLRIRTVRKCSVWKRQTVGDIWKAKEINSGYDGAENARGFTVQSPGVTPPPSAIPRSGWKIKTLKRAFAPLKSCFNHGPAGEHTHVRSSDRVWRSVMAFCAGLVLSLKEP